MEENNQPPSPIEIPKIENQDILLSVPVEEQPAVKEARFYGLTIAGLRTLLVKILLGCLIAAAAVAVVAVLLGSMTDVVWRAVWTIAVAMLHIAILFGIVSMTPAHETETSYRSTNLLINTTLVIAICSFFTAVLNIWGVFDGALASKLYATYVVALVSIIHAKVLMDTASVYDKVKAYVYANYCLIILLAFLLLGVIYPDNGFEILNGFYGRLLAATAIVNVTLTTVVAVMQHLYLQKHPELKTSVPRRVSLGKLIVIILLVLFLGGPILSGLFLWAAFR